MRLVKYLRKYAFVTLCLLIIIRGISLIFLPIFRDEYEHLHSSWLILNGNQPFNDFFQHHSALLWYFIASVGQLFQLDDMSLVWIGRSLSCISYLLGFALLLNMRRTLSSGNLFIVTLIYLLIPSDVFFQIRPEVFLIPPTLYLLNLLIRGNASRFDLMTTATAVVVMISSGPRSFALIGSFCLGYLLLWKRSGLSVIVSLVIGVFLGLLFSIQLCSGLENYWVWVIKFSTELRPVTSVNSELYQKYVILPAIFIALTLIFRVRNFHFSKAEIIIHCLFVISCLVAISERCPYEQSFVFVFITGLSSLLISTHNQNGLLAKSLLAYTAIIYLLWLNPTYAYSNLNYLKEVIKYKNNSALSAPKIFRQIEKQELQCKALGEDVTYFDRSELHAICAKDSSYYWFNHYLIFNGTPLPDNAPSFCSQFLRFVGSPKLAIMQQLPFKVSVEKCLSQTDQLRVFERLSQSHIKLKELWVRKDLEAVIKNNYLD